MNNQEQASAYFSRACAKLRLAQDYLEMYDYYNPKKECLLYDLSVMLGDALRDLDTIAFAIPDDCVRRSPNRRA